MNAKICFLYVTRQFDRLLPLLLEGPGTVEIFRRIYFEDSEFNTWFTFHERRLWQELILRNPGMEAALREFYIRMGNPAMFEFKRSCYATGFATVEQVAAAAGCSTAEVEALLAAGEVFEGRIIRKGEPVLLPKEGAR